MQQMKMRISDRNASIVKDQFVSLDFDYKLYRTIKKRQKVTVKVENRLVEMMEKREWYDIVVTTNSNWSLKLESYFNVLQNHNFISHFELI